MMKCNQLGVTKENMRHICAGCTGCQDKQEVSEKPSRRVRCPSILKVAGVTREALASGCVIFPTLLIFLPPSFLLHSSAYSLSSHSATHCSRNQQCRKNQDHIRFTCSEYNKKCTCNQLTVFRFVYFC